ncbi:MAG TPA: hypothetical protein VEP90_15465 [Methylomirabilota bacterium]|nr:hypothetical protein [Methylomirabilota bacterium]
MTDKLLDQYLKLRYELDQENYVRTITLIKVEAQFHIQMGESSSWRHIEVDC